jgi:hypothetical protein
MLFISVSDKGTFAADNNLTVIFAIHLCDSNKSCFELSVLTTIVLKRYLAASSKLAGIL